MFWRTCSIAVALALLPGPALAQAPPPVAANTVRCTYETLSQEDREIALLLIFVRTDSEEKLSESWGRNLVVANRLLDAARSRCRAAYGWNRTKGRLAYDYAMSALTLEAVGQAVESDGSHSLKPIERFFHDHQARLRKLSGYGDEDIEGFAEYLSEQGWDEEEDKPRALAKSYLKALIRRDAHERSFAAQPAR